MKQAAKIVCWVCGILGVVVSLFGIFRTEVLLGPLIKDLVELYDATSYADGEYYINLINTTKIICIVIFIVDIIVKIIVLIWRDKAVEKGNKIASGVVTLLFVSRIGGILTLCIPDNELIVHYDYNGNSY